MFPVELIAWYYRILWRILHVVNIIICDWFKDTQLSSKEGHSIVYELHIHYSYQCVFFSWV